MKRNRAVLLFVIGAGLLFGIAGGEYSTIDWWKLTRDVRAQQKAVELLRREVDSLAVAAEALETDPVTQERVAREAFGMIRPGEILYRVERDEEEGR